MNNLTKSSVNQVILWAIAAPVITSWALVSFIPLFSLFEPVSLTDLFVQIVFLGSGFPGLLGAILFAALTKTENVERLAPHTAGSRRVVGLAAWSLVWMTAYSAYTLL